MKINNDFVNEYFEKVQKLSKSKAEQLKKAAGKDIPRVTYFKPIGHVPWWKRPWKRVLKIFYFFFPFLRPARRIVSYDWPDLK